MKTALLLSGGQDSIALAFWKKPDFAITIDYGQVPAQAEIAAAKAVCAAIGIRHEVVHANCSSIGSGDMAGTPTLSAAPVPEWWPYRNQLVLTLAAARALALDAQELLIGTVVTDKSHTDGTSIFIEAMDKLLYMQEGNLRCSAPAIDLSSSQLVKQSAITFELLAWAHSCHRSNLACGKCRGCIKHKNVLHELGLDPY